MTGKGTCHQTQQPKFVPGTHMAERKSIAHNDPLITKFKLWHRLWNITLTMQRRVTFVYAGEYYFNHAKVCYICLCWGILL